MQPTSRPTFSIPLTPPTRRVYTGVDKLILAAYVEESAAVAAAAAAVAATTTTTTASNSQRPQPQSQAYHHYMPIGRGLGYCGNHTRNGNSQIPIPSNKSELELYRLLDRANLLNYFGTFLNFGGDDVQQLIDADEDEFLEIMSLVGMTQKPLHVRRLQKALIEWNENKEMFESSFRSSHGSTSASVSNQALVNPIMADSPLSASLNNFSRSSSTTNGNATNGDNHNNSSISNDESDDQQQQQQQYVPPYEILRGAPKRPRLMDNLHRKLFSSNQQANSILSQPLAIPPRNSPSPLPEPQQNEQQEQEKSNNKTPSRHNQEQD